MSSTTYVHARNTVASLNRFIKGSVRRRKSEPASHFDRDRQTARSIFYDANIFGFGIGTKVTNEKQIAAELSLVFFVRKKLPRSRLKHGVMIPDRFALQTVGRKVQTDVLECHRSPVAQAGVSAGASIGDTGGNAGTMTLAVTDSRSGGQLILGCSHVLACCGGRSVGDPVESPANLAADPSPNIVGFLKRFTTIDPARTDNGVDAAVALPA